MKNLSILIALVFICFSGQGCTESMAQEQHHTENATCTGAASCWACKNCKYCKHCNSGGKCGVCW